MDSGKPIKFNLKGKLMQSNNFIEIKDQSLVFNFAGIKEKFSINFQRTLRIPDDNKTYNLPPGLGKFELSHVEDYIHNLPETWAKHGGIFFPMYQSEAMWLSFVSPSGRPFAVKIASGKVNAINGETWSDKLNAKNNFTEQDYIVAPDQPWLDGFNVGKDVIAQFVAVPLSSGYTVEEQVTGKDEFGGVQIIVYPMKEAKYQELLKKNAQNYYRGIHPDNLPGGAVYACASASSGFEGAFADFSLNSEPDMGLGAGGKMCQQIYLDQYGIDAWEDVGLRVFVHLANSVQYKAITNKDVPHSAPNTQSYAQYGYPWFDYYMDKQTVSPSNILSKIDSIASMQAKKCENILTTPEDKPSMPPIQLGMPKNSIKDGNW